MSISIWVDFLNRTQDPARLKERPMKKLQISLRCDMAWRRYVRIPLWLCDSSKGSFAKKMKRFPFQSSDKKTKQINRAVNWFLITNVRELTSCRMKGNCDSVTTATILAAFPASSVMPLHLKNTLQRIHLEQAKSNNNVPEFEIV